MQDAAGLHGVQVQSWMIITFNPRSMTHFRMKVHSDTSLHLALKEASEHSYDFANCCLVSGSNLHKILLLLLLSHGECGVRTSDSTVRWRTFTTDVSRPCYVQCQVRRITAFFFFLVQADQLKDVCVRIVGSALCGLWNLRRRCKCGNVLTINAWFGFDCETQSEPWGNFLASLSIST